MYLEIITIYFVILAVILYLSPRINELQQYTNLINQYNMYVSILNILLFAVIMYQYINTSTTCVIISIMISSFFYTLNSLKFGKTIINIIY
jgi:hypothetical protein